MTEEKPEENTTAEAMKAEALSKPAQFEFMGVKLEIEGDEMEMDANAMRAIEQKRYHEYCEIVLGPQQFAAVRKAGCVKVKHMFDLYVAILTAFGTSAGE